MKQENLNCCLEIGEMQECYIYSMNFLYIVNNSLNNRYIIQDEMPPDIIIDDNLSIEFDDNPSIEF